MKTYLFPGQGSQIKGMGEALFDKFTELTKKADTILGYSIKELCINDAKKQLHQTQYTQPALYTVNALSYELKITEIGEIPDFVAGHSLGEYNALVVAGVISFEEGLNLVKKRGNLMSKASRGAMVAILGSTEKEIKKILMSSDLIGIDIANYNSPSQTVISGREEDIQKIQSFLKKEGIKCIPLNTSGAFHSRYMESAKAEFEKYLKEFKFSELKIPVISNVHARPYKQDEIALNLSNQITHPVRWSESMQYLIGQGDMEFEEIGPGNVLTKLIENIQEQTTPLVIEEKIERQRNESTTKEEIVSEVETEQKIDLASEAESVSEVETSPRAAWEQEKKELQKRIDNWNKTYPIGTKVTVDGYDGKLETRTKAMILFGHRAAIYMQGYNGYFALDEVVPVSETQG